MSTHRNAFTPLVTTRNKPDSLLGAAWGQDRGVDELKPGSLSCTAPSSQVTLCTHRVFPVSEEKLQCEQRVSQAHTNGAVRDSRKYSNPCLLCTSRRLPFSNHTAHHMALVLSAGHKTWTMAVASLSPNSFDRNKPPARSLSLRLPIQTSQPNKRTEQPGRDQIKALACHPNLWLQMSSGTGKIQRGSQNIQQA